MQENISNPSFPNFAREIRLHSNGYHRLYGSVEISQQLDWFALRSIQCPRPYSEFLSEIGPGRFFSGALDIFEVHPGGTLDRATLRLPDHTKSQFFAFAYDGTTEGCFCLARSGADDSVYWIDWKTGSRSVEHRNFRSWIEEAPAKLFNESVYAGYTRIKDLPGALRVIEERRRYEVKLVQYDKRLVRMPGNEKALLPRYNRLVCRIRQLEESPLRQLTLKVFRTESTVGRDNIQFVTLQLPDEISDHECNVEAYAFDPFNVPFQDIAIEYSPEIDLASPTRTRFAEIKAYL